MVAMSNTRTRVQELSVEARDYRASGGYESRLVSVGEGVTVSIGTIDHLRGGRPDSYWIEVEDETQIDSLISAERFEADGREAAVERFYRRLGEAIWSAAFSED